MADLKKVEITRRPGFRDGVPFRFAGQQSAPMSEDEKALFIQGEFEPEPLSEPIDVELELPPLSFDQLKEKKTRSLMDGISPESISEEAIDAINTIVMIALSRNYKGVPGWLVRQSIDVSNMPDLIKSLMDVSGLHRKDMAEKKAMSQQQKSTGTTSASS